MIGHTQTQAAEAVGRSERTVRDWESDPERWPRAQEEARGRWLHNATDAARKAVLRSLNAGNAELGKWLLERVEPALAPPKQRAELTGPEGGPLEVTVTRRIIRPDANG
jgi:hypothetical protein